MAPTGRALGCDCRGSGDRLHGSMGAENSSACFGMRMLTVDNENKTLSGTTQILSKVF